jgi:hypothetical protein
VDAYGNYYRTNGAAFGPGGLCWTYTNTPATNFFSPEISGAQRLPNGNTLITWGTRGILFEVASNLQTMWYYVDPVTRDSLAQGSTIPFDPNSNPNFPPQTLNEVFKVHRYLTNFPGFAGKDLTPRGTIETYTGAATDTVGLGLPDVWVRAHFSTLGAVSTNSDHDGDGLTDIQEYGYGLNPTAWSSANNGIPDGWALRFGFDPTLASVANIINANGNTTLQNYIADLNPTNSASRLALTAVQVNGSNVSLAWIGGNNAWQYLECSSTLSSNQWTTIFTNAPPTPTTNIVIHSIAGGSSNLFYHIKATR